MTFPTFEQALAIQKAMYQERMLWAKANDTRRLDLEELLRDAGVQNVEVWMLAAAAFLGLLTTTPYQRNGMAMKFEGGYVIFVSDQLIRGDWWPPALGTEGEERLVALHEGCHILQGEVFEDDQEGRYKILHRGHFGDWQVVCLLAQEELRADEFAANRLTQLAQAAGNTQLVADLAVGIEQRRKNS